MEPPRSLRSLPPEGALGTLGRPGGSEAAADRQWLCASADLVERGLGFVFDVMLWGAPARAFALRFDGRIVAYLNRCAHVPSEMDWQAGHFLDRDQRWILCSTHGAAYEPADGRCVGGPCGKGRLMPIETVEADGGVYWYPSRDIQPFAFDAAPGAVATAPVPESKP